MRYLKNLTSQALTKGLPWEYKPTTPIPDIVRTDKKKRDSWINAPSTDHCVYTAFEGVIENVRISRARSDGGGNPVYKLHALVADFDAPQPEESALKAAREFNPPPNWMEKTLSGNWRGVWLLARPLGFPSESFAKHFLKTFPAFAFDPGMLLPAFDKGAWEAVERLYTNSCDWRHLHDNVLPAEMVTGWLLQANKTFKWTDREGTVIPLDAVKTELASKYPRFSSWPGDFALGSQGPTFWIEDSQSPKSAIVRETGIQTFSEHAPKAFYSWADLVGIDFCKEYKSKAAGRAVEGIYYDGRSYWRQLDDTTWLSLDKGDIIGHLKTARRVSTKSENGGSSDVDHCIEYIQSHQKVENVASFIYRPSGLWVEEGLRYLNTCRTQVMRPADCEVVWGGNLWFLADRIDNLFTTPEQVPYFMSWVAYAYQHAYRLAPMPGQAALLVGGVGVGKTFVSNEVIGPILGGFADPTDYLLGKDKFGAELFTKGLWATDDQRASILNREHRFYSDSIKRIVANEWHKVHEKYAMPRMVRWPGRFLGTLNADPESARTIPTVDISILDKLMLFRAVEKPHKPFPSREEVREHLKRELPLLARYLLDFKFPKHCIGDSRYGIIAYHEPTILRMAQRSSPTATSEEIFDEFRRVQFGVLTPEAPHWEGTAFQLHKAIMSDAGAANSLRNFSVDTLSRHLCSLLLKKVPYLEIVSDDPIRIWRVYRPETLK